MPFSSRPLAVEKSALFICINLAFARELHGIAYEIGDVASARHAAARRPPGAVGRAAAGSFRAFSCDQLRVPGEVLPMVPEVRITGQDAADLVTVHFQGLAHGRGEALPARASPHGFLQRLRDARIFFERPMGPRALGEGLLKRDAVGN
jgi:hypothetical protein